MTRTQHISLGDVGQIDDSRGDLPVAVESKIRVVRRDPITGEEVEVKPKAPPKPAEKLGPEVTEPTTSEKPRVAEAATLVKIEATSQPDEEALDDDQPDRTETAGNQHRAARGRRLGAMPPRGAGAQQIAESEEESARRRSMTRADLPPVLTIEEAAAYLRIGRATAYRAARRGELPCVRIGKSLRVPRDRLLELLEQGQAPITRGKSA